MSDATFISRRAALPTGVRPAAITVRDGAIVAVADPEDRRVGGPVIDVGDRYLLPGLVDTHVHCEDPGRTEWEDFETATRAAAAGGLTVLVDMPLDCRPVTTSPGALAVKIAAARGRCHVDLGFWGGLVPHNLDRVDDMLDAGCLGLKAFLIPSGLDDFPEVGEAELRAAMPALARRGRPLLVHAELAGPSGELPPGCTRYADYLAARPPRMERLAIRMMIRLCRETGCPVHIVHLSDAGSLPELAAARAEGLPVTVETCPHYLIFSAEEIADGQTALKCAPPIRGAANRERLWAGLKAGHIDLIACDHSPCTPAMRAPDAGDFAAAWAGIAGLQLTLPLLWTHGRRRGCTVGELVRWLAEAPARLAGLGRRKGHIAVGHDADLVVWDGDVRTRVTPESLRIKHRTTPYDGMQLAGQVVSTWLRGALIYDHSSTGEEAPTGRLLLDRAPLARS